MTCMRAYLGNREKGSHSAQEQIDLLTNHKRYLAEKAYNLQLKQHYVDAKIAYWRAVLAGDEEKAGEIGESARSISEALRASRKSCLV